MNYRKNILSTYLAKIFIIMTVKVVIMTFVMTMTIFVKGKRRSRRKRRMGILKALLIMLKYHLLLIVTF